MLPAATPVNEKSPLPLVDILVGLPPFTTRATVTPENGAPVWAKLIWPLIEKAWPWADAFVSNVFDRKSTIRQPKPMRRISRNLILLIV